MVTITNKPDLFFQGLFFSKHISLKNAVSYQLSGESLTKETALRALKQVKWRSDLKSFLAKPIVVIALGSALLGVSIAIPVMATSTFALWFIKSFLAILAGFFLAHVIYEYQKGNASQLSEAYSKQSQLAAEMITKFELA